MVSVQPAAVRLAPAGDCAFPSLDSDAAPFHADAPPARRSSPIFAAPLLAAARRFSDELLRAAAQRCQGFRSADCSFRAAATPRRPPTWYLRAKSAAVPLPGTSAPAASAVAPGPGLQPNTRPRSAARSPQDQR